MQRAKRCAVLFSGVCRVIHEMMQFVDCVFAVFLCDCLSNTCPQLAVDLQLVGGAINGKTLLATPHITHTCTHTHAHNTHTHTHTQTYAHTRTCTHTHAHAHTHTQTHLISLMS